MNRIISLVASLALFLYPFSVALAAAPTSHYDFVDPLAIKRVDVGVAAHELSIGGQTFTCATSIFLCTYVTQGNFVKLSGDDPRPGSLLKVRTIGLQRSAKTQGTTWSMTGIVVVKLVLIDEVKFTLLERPGVFKALRCPRDGQIGDLCVDLPNLVEFSFSGHLPTAGQPQDYPIDAISQTR